ncbi:MAG: ABC transporter substrate-binding protein [Alphaproteobacteria bacterium]|jgi:putative ABC transport system substrate-binding protein|nr:MAG: ABC transporter substrate-binding protein [Alphaproteobacteria bacterium]
MNALLRRRNFITLLGGAAAWPVAARAQGRAGVRRIGVLNTLAADDAVAQARYGAFLQGLQQAGWTIGRNVQVETRWGAGDPDRLRTYAAELVALAPEVILATGNAATAPLLQATRTVPIVFAIVPDPVGAGFVNSLAQPGGNVTGFISNEYGLSPKWLELLKEIAPNVTRAGIIRDPALVSGPAQFAAIQSMAPSLGMEVTPINVRDASDIERAIIALARVANTGLVVIGSAVVAFHRHVIIALAARYKLPAVYVEGAYVDDGGLISYGADFLDQYRRASGYVDRILKGEKAADLPVQAPTRYELVVNLKTAKALGLDIPPAVLARADRVVE